MTLIDAASHEKAMKNLLDTREAVRLDVAKSAAAATAIYYYETVVDSAAGRRPGADVGTTTERSSS